MEVAARWTMPSGFRVIGVSTGRAVPELKARLLRHANEAAEALDAPFRFQAEDFIRTDDYVGESYGVLTTGCVEAIRLVARTEGILLDPVCTAKSMAGMIDMIRRGELTSNDTVVFLHTGGTPALFAYDTDLKEKLEL